jgi:hypothetical protein
MAMFVMVKGHSMQTVWQCLRYAMAFPDIQSWSAYLWDPYPWFGSLERLRWWYELFVQVGEDLHVRAFIMSKRIACIQGCYCNLIDGVPLANDGNSFSCMSRSRFHLNNRFHLRVSMETLKLQIPFRTSAMCKSSSAAIHQICFV